MRVLLLLLAIATAAPLAAQDAAKDAPGDTPKEVKPRIYIAAGASWRQNGPGSSSKSELELREVEIDTDFSHSCGTVTITADIKAANYVLEFSRHVAGVPLTAIAVDRTDVSVYRTTADLVGASSKGSLGSAVKAACELIRKDWPEAPHDVAPPKRRDPHPTGRTASYPQ